MQLKVKKENKDGVVRLESSGIVKEIIVNENLLNPDEESVSICYRGKNSSGIIDFTPAEIDKIFESVKNRMHLIKGLKRFSGSGAIITK
ncbi:hypothetical protein COV19_05600 [Candidatus Woesearchaeota archaeon CG10_big_fil_rev_8_21_14_0_10_44_13]|nr:MAG: hypothetical protein COV19_05600 [Candidatus Woesearchaeota archaeon CG10_big_fil_rev_8_21_14_0_10_44_13]